MIVKLKKVFPGVAHYRKMCTGCFKVTLAQMNSASGVKSHCKTWDHRLTVSSKHGILCSSRLSNFFDHILLEVKVVPKYCFQDEIDVLFVFKSV